MLLHSSPAASSACPARLRRLILALLCLSTLGGAADAGTLTVPAQYATIQSAINSSVSGDTVLISDGIYAGPGNVDLDLGGRSDLTIASVNGPAKTVIDCQGTSSANHRGFLLHSGETNALIGGLTIKNGYESGNGGYGSRGGGILCGGSSVTVQNCLLTANTVQDYGGGVYTEGTATLTGCTFTGNAAGYGGGLDNDGGTAALTNCTFTSNTALDGGGLNSGGGGTAALTGCAFTGNTGLSYGGGLYSAAGAVILTGCAFTANTAQTDGGGLFNYGAVTLTGCTLIGNTAKDWSGGGLFNDLSGGTATVTNCVFTGNAARQWGGGLFNNGGTVSVLNSSFTANTAQAACGGLFNSVNSTATLTNDILYGDTGGELYNDGSGPATASDCDVGGGLPARVTDGGGNLNADPLFVSAPADLHLKTGSPCWGAGTVSGAPHTTLDGYRRPNPPSIGAYELGGILTVSPYGTYQYTTIQAAIDVSVSGDTVIVEDGTYTGPGNVDVDFGGRNVTVTSANGPAKTIIDCGGHPSSDGSGNHRGFYLHRGETGAVISGLTVRNGYEASVAGILDSGYGGGIDISFSGFVSVTLQNCALQGNTAQEGGGGLFSDNNHGGTTTLTDCVLSSNSAPGGAGGGGMYNGGAATLTHCGLSNNSSQGGGGLRNDGTATLTDCALSGNAAQFYSGGLFNQGTATLTDCSLTANTTQDSGGGLYNNGGTVGLTNCTLTANAAGNYCGGLLNDGTATVTNCAITGSTALYGFGVGLYNRGPATLTNDILYGDMGGELHNDRGVTITAAHCDFAGGLPSGVTDNGGNVSADPLFADAAHGDLHLRPNSPCFGAGTASNAPTTDKDGRVRPSPPSIGAYEQVSTLAVPAQYATIQSAIDASTSGDTVLISDGSYTGPGDVDLDFGGRSIAVTSVSGPAMTVIDCQGSATVNHRGFYLHSGETNAVISGLTVKNGYESYASSIPNSNTGGGIEVSGFRTSVTVQNCTLTANTAAYEGGGLSDENGGIAALTHCALITNTATYGGGLSNDSGGTVTLTNCTLSGNTAGYNGGGLYNSGALTLTGCGLTANAAQYGDGGGLYNGGMVTLTDCALAANTAQNYGGGLFNYGLAALTNCTLTGNTERYGGGLTNHGGTITLTNAILYGDAVGEVNNLFGGTASADHCDVGGGLPAGTTDGGGNLNADPLFVLAASPYDLHLRPGSPCLGAGTASGAPTTTLDGKTRPNPPSIGAYEASPLPATTVTVTNLIGSAGQTVTLSAVLKTTAGAALSGKTLTFSVDGAAVGTGVTSAGGVATKTYVISASLAVGAHTLAAAFAGSDTGDAAYAASSGAGVLSVVKAATTLSVSAALGSPGQTVALKATLKRVAGGAALPGAAVTFSIDGVAFGTAGTTGAGLASLNYVIPAGSAIGSAHTINAAFTGDGSYSASSGAGKLSVSRYAAGLSVAAVTGVPGQTVTLSATLRRTVGGAAVPGEAVYFAVDGATLGSGVTNASGVATLTTVILGGAAPGPHPVTATFGGDASYAGVIAKGTLTVKNAAVLSVINVSGARATTVTLGASLTAGGRAAPGKTVTFKVDGTSVVTAVTDANGVATATYAIPSTAKPGSHPVAASFAGDAADNPAVGAGTLTVS